MPLLLGFILRSPKGTEWLEESRQGTLALLSLLLRGILAWSEDIAGLENRLDLVEFTAPQSLDNAVTFFYGGALEELG